MRERIEMEGQKEKGADEGVPKVLKTNCVFELNALLLYCSNELIHQGQVELRAYYIPLQIDFQKLTK